MLIYKKKKLQEKGVVCLYLPAKRGGTSCHQSATRNWPPSEGCPLPPASPPPPPPPPRAACRRRARDAERRNGVPLPCPPPHPSLSPIPHRPSLSAAPKTQNFCKKKKIQSLSPFLAARERTRIQKSRNQNAFFFFFFFSRGFGFGRRTRAASERVSWEILACTGRGKTAEETGVRESMRRSQNRMKCKNNGRREMRERSR